MILNCLMLPPYEIPDIFETNETIETNRGFGNRLNNLNSPNNIIGLRKGKTETNGLTPGIDTTTDIRSLALYMLAVRRTGQRTSSPAVIPGKPTAMSTFVPD
jgi:hypothetical protein